jgi:hypothetical protein
VAAAGVVLGGKTGRGVHSTPFRPLDATLRGITEHGPPPGQAVMLVARPSLFLLLLFASVEVAGLGGEE